MPGNILFRALFSFIRAFLVITGLIYVVMVLGFAFNQNYFIFFPTHHADKNAVWHSPDGKYLGVMFPAKDPQRIFLMMHGNGGQAGDRSFLLQALPEGSSLYVLEYPGYGNCAGVISQKNINAAALGGFDCLKQQFPKIPIILVGESLGNGPAAWVAHKRPAMGIILITPYDSFPGLVQEKVPFLPAGWICAYRWNVADLLQDFTNPIIVFGAKNDRVIPVRHAQNLVNHLPSARLVLIEGGHNSYDLSAVKKSLADEPELVAQPTL